MAGMVDVKVVNLEKILRKINAETLTTPQKRWLIKESVDYGKGYLSGRIPRASGTSAGRLATNIGGEKGTLSLPAKPLRFIEFGTQTGGRSRSRRTNAQWKAGTYRIAPRRFMRRTYAAALRNLRNVLIPQADKRIEQAWKSS